MPLPLTTLFPDQDYRFHLTLRRGDLPTFFAPQNPAALAERSLWLDKEPARYALGTPASHPLVAEFEAMAEAWQTDVHTRDPEVELHRKLVRLGRKVEADFLLLDRAETGAFTLRAGVVCFPTSWALAEKIGLTLDSIHGVVPGLNPAMGPTIDQFLGKLKPGAPFERSNWGLAATPELNLHPALNRQRLEGPFDLERTWVRIEDQILAALPVTGGILFGIALRIIPLRTLLADPLVKRGFHRAISTLPPELAYYKGLSVVLPHLINVST